MLLTYVEKSGDFFSIFADENILNHFILAIYKF
jgi:hypothetical protein